MIKVKAIIAKIAKLLNNLIFSPTLCSHSASLLGDRLVIFGGWDFPQCFNDVSIIDLGKSHKGTLEAAWPSG